ncbi:MAG: YchF/TatD family DNA exonuclease [Alphaproteobacteria bacterium]|nr:YchF/TatD family DNA exonuclease [Alphaproteobacteria bacterium]
MQLIDSHCHLDYPVLSKDREAVFTRARDAGVEKMLCISVYVSKFDQIKVIAEENENVFCTVGLHPHHAAEETELAAAENLQKLAQHPKVVGIGESGLDYFYDRSPRDLQHEVFRQHMRACVACDLPLIVHSRDADDDTARMIREEGAGGKLKGVMHCFSSGRSLAEAALTEGFYISFSGILTFKKSEELRAIARDVPLNRLLVETDAPYLAPEPYRGKPNEPSYVVHTAQVLADVKGVSLGELANATTENFYRLFSKVPH